MSGYTASDGGWFLDSAHNHDGHPNNRRSRDVTSAIQRPGSVARDPGGDDIRLW
jgi:hypothetical protein